MLLILFIGAQAQPTPGVQGFINSSSVIVRAADKPAILRIGEQLGNWILMGVVEKSSTENSNVAVFEDFTRVDGRVIFVDAGGLKIALQKTSEPTSADSSKLYCGHSIKEVMSSADDLLGNEVLANAGDPEYEQVAAAFPPIRNMSTYSFVGTQENFDKIGFAYGGRTANFDPAPYDPAIAKARDKGEVRDGLVGGDLPILRFVYPESEGIWAEMIAFAPLRIANGNSRIQPVWYRIAKIEHGALKSVRYIDSYHPFPPRRNGDPNNFYSDMFRLHHGWERTLSAAMKVELPDERVANMARFALVRELMTRVGDYPKYGVVDKDYAGTEHDGFPDTFNVDTTAMLEWGLVDIAGRYIENYFGKFVRDDGSILYRGPEVGQYGRMLTVLAEYVNDGGNPYLLLKLRPRIDGVTKLLLALRAKAKELAPSHPAYGMIAGWSEADASLDPDPPRYMQPYFSNSAEAIRGFRDLGLVWEKLGRQRKNSELLAWGQNLQRESTELLGDLHVSISRSTLNWDGEKILPAIAGVSEPFHVAVVRDKADPQFRSYRAYAEMLYSGVLTNDEARMIVSYRAHHHDLILGMPAAYGFNTGIMAGFLSYGHGYGLIHHDMVRQALLMMYSDMAHQYTRGMWTAPETRSILPGEGSAPYCTPAQLVIALMTKWLLVFEDPESETLWLAKAVPRKWLDDGKNISVSSAPTRWGRLDYTITSHFKSNEIDTVLKLPFQMKAETKLRLRPPDARPMRLVTVNGKQWAQFDPASETITIPPGTGSHITIVARY